MKSTKDVTALVYDNGLFCSLAERLTRDYKRVLYFSPWEKGFSLVNDACIGDGIPGVERVSDIWAVKDEVDLWVFPDIQHRGLQLELESQGHRVWGARAGDELELNRELFLDTLKELGLDVPSYEVTRGITALREHLREKENCYIKISKFRGSLETSHWRSWKLDENLLDVWAVRFGGVRELIKFLVFDAIDTPLEIGGDTYCIDGRWPAQMLHGIEAKDKGYFGAVTSTEQMPEQIKVVMDAFKPVLAKYRYRNFWSMEVRVLDDKGYFIDPTCRGGLPSSASQMELWSNLGEIIWAGANGELVEPEPSAKFSAEVLLKVKGEKGAWRKCEIPNELRRWVKLTGHCEVDGVAWFPPDESGDDACGWLVAKGPTPGVTLMAIKDVIEVLPEGLTADAAPLADVINAIEEGEEQGIEFSKSPLPEAGAVLEPSV
jgi:hypothetical protein